MKDLRTYIKEAEESDEKDDEKTTRRGKIKYTIWLEPKKQAGWLEDGQDYNKIEYQYEDKDKGISIDFLLGYVKEENTWKLWIGKIGAIGYDDEPTYDLCEEKFAEAIIKSLDKTEEFLEDVEENPDNWVQFYKSK